MHFVIEGEMYFPVGSGSDNCSDKKPVGSRAFIVIFSCFLHNSGLVL